MIIIGLLKTHAAAIFFVAEALSLVAGERRANETRHLCMTVLAAVCRPDCGESDRRNGSSHESSVPNRPEAET
jgi:hypothetical protein